MTLLFADGFDHYTSTTLGRKWDINGSAGNYATISSGNTRFGVGQGLQITYAGAYIEKTLPGASTWIVGFALKVAANSFWCLQFFDTSILQILVYITPSYAIQINRGSGTLLGISNTIPVLRSGNWVYAEVKVIIHPTIGSVEVRVQGVTVLLLNNVNTSASGTTVANMMRFNDSNNGSSQLYLDDIYICNGSGIINNSFLGDIRVDTLYPTGVGTTTQWTPGAGSNYAQVNSATPDDDTTYVESSTSGNKDTYQMGNLAGTPNYIQGVQVVQLSKKTDAGFKNMQNVLRIGGADYLLGSSYLNDYYYYSLDMEELSPATTGAFTLTEINALEAGYTVL